jgi:GNAT superfamily N-acetyltransferase
MIRKATDKDIASIAVIYDLVLKQEEDGRTTIGWQRGVYPTEEVARQAVLRGDMYVLEDEKTHDISAAAIINHIQDSANKEGKWSIEADGNEVLALHTLVVNPQESGKGLGTAFVDFYEQMAKNRLQNTPYEHWSAGFRCPCILSHTWLQGNWHRLQRVQ